MADEPREAEWIAFQAEIGQYLRDMFNLRSQREQDVWLYVLGLAAELEFVAVILLRYSFGMPRPYDRMTLGQAAEEIERRGLLDAGMIETMKAVAKVRNSVAHGRAVLGVALAEEERGFYKGRHVFTDLDALKQLTTDVAFITTDILERTRR